MSDFPCDHIRFFPEVAIAQQFSGDLFCPSEHRSGQNHSNRSEQNAPVQDEGMKESIPAIRIPNSTNLDAVPLELKVLPRQVTALPPPFRVSPLHRSYPKRRIFFENSIFRSICSTL